MAPELYADNDESSYSCKVDVWALNTCLYKMLTKNLYYWAINKNDLRKMICDKPFVISKEFNLSP
jgi:hypothetical protein